MPGVLSTMRYGTNDSDDLPATSRTTIFESSSASSDESDNSDSSSYIAEYEETEEDKEASKFMNNILKDQSRKDGDFQRIESLLVGNNFNISNK